MLGDGAFERRVEDVREVGLVVRLGTEADFVGLHDRVADSAEEVVHVVGKVQAEALVDGVDDRGELLFRPVYAPGAGTPRAGEYAG